MQASVIISTYNSPLWLKKVLEGYAHQNRKDFEVLVADDGSDNRTKEVIESFQDRLTQIKHIWHPDQGFQKCKILNKAIKHAETEYLIFSDGDCIPRNDFVTTHLKYRKKRRFLSGGYFKLPMELSQAIDARDIENQKCFNLSWLRDHGLGTSFKNFKLVSNQRITNFLNKLTPTNPTWNGHNASGWKKDILAVNGFDERMRYGGEDRELGERLINKQVYPIQIRYKAICVHLDHKRDYVTEEDWEKNNQIRRQTLRNRACWTPFGIFQSAMAR